MVVWPREADTSVIMHTLRTVEAGDRGFIVALRSTDVREIVLSDPTPGTPNPHCRTSTRGLQEDSWLRYNSGVSRSEPGQIVDRHAAVEITLTQPQDPDQRSNSSGTVVKCRRRLLSLLGQPLSMLENESVRALPSKNIALTPPG